jgi:hypothetical protein
MDGRAAPVFATMRRSIAIPPARSSTPRTPVPPTGVLFMGTVTLAQSAMAGPSVSVVAAICAAEIFGLAGFSIAAATVHRGLVADQHASRLARGDHIRWLYARRHPSGQPDRPAARPATLSRFEQASAGQSAESERREQTVAQPHAHAGQRAEYALYVADTHTLFATPLERHLARRRWP